MEVRSYRTFTKAGFLTVRARVWTCSTATITIVCAHGISRNSSDFIKLGRQFQADYNVVAVDLIGHGMSDLPESADDYLTGIQTASLAGVLTQIPASQKIVWLGTSFGGSVGLRLAAQRGSPIQGLILNDVGTIISGENILSLKERFRRLPKFECLAAAKPFVRHMLGMKPSVGTEDELEQYARYNLWHDPADNSWRLAFDPRLIVYFERHQDEGSDFTQLWENLNCPALIFRGELSHFLSARDVEEMLQRQPRAKAAVVPQAKHPPDLSGPEPVASIRSWINEIFPECSVTRPSCA